MIIFYQPLIITLVIQDIIDTLILYYKYLSSIIIFIIKIYSRITKYIIVFFRYIKTFVKSFSIINMINIYFYKPFSLWNKACNIIIITIKFIFFTLRIFNLYFIRVFYWYIKKDTVCKILRLSLRFHHCNHYIL